MTGSVEKESQRQAVQEPPKAGPSFPVVGLGASAGGLQALKDFFTHMPPASGMAFVVILHLSPKHESHAASLLQTATAMPVTQVTQTVKVEPNHVYVIPPTNNLEMTDGEINLTEQQRLQGGKQVAIDLFFRTLGDTHKQNAVGIILSGMGSDGTSGLKRIKEQNGLAFAQDPADAEHDSMPRHAINSGLVDFVLPASEMPEKLVGIWRTASRIKLPPEIEPPPVITQEDAEEAALRDILLLLRARTGHDFIHYKRATVLRRIERRLQVNQLVALAPYRDFMRDHPTEAQSLLKDLLISVTSFFRDRAAFAEFEREIVPLLFKEKTTGDQVRVWVAGCATGEEAYSVAMLLLEYAEQLPQPPSVQVFATDIDEGAIATAREGSYPESIEADVSPERLRSFFTRESGRYRIKKDVRARVLFAVHNLIKDPPFSKLDAITCRNLLIYLNRDAQKHILELFHFVLRPNGFLFIGNSESAESMGSLFATIGKKNRLYRAENVAPATRRVPSLPLAVPLLRASAPQTHETRERQKISFGEFHQKLLQQYTSPSVIINADHEIMHLSDGASRFLKFVGGEPSHNLLRVVDPDLRLNLRTALFQAAQTGVSTEARGAKIKRDDRMVHVNMIARPVRDDETGTTGNYFLVLFDEVEALTGAPGEAEIAADSEPVTRLLEEELQRTKEQYQTTIDQYETQSEELKASNEELQAMNEELHSATEELETGKEELQSVNEEISTINNDLKNRIAELALANNDLQNLITSTDLATIFVDRDLHIKFYTPRAQDIFNLIPSDTGRPLSDITHKLDYAHMLQDVKRVLHDSLKTEIEVTSHDGRWYLAQLIPYRVAENNTDGVILTFVDFTSRKQAENEKVAAKAGLERRTIALMDINAALQAEVRERQRAERDRGQLLRRIVFTQEEERRRIAREVHDEFGQQLTVLKLKLDALKEDCGDDANACKQIETLQSVAMQLDAAVDHLVRDLRPTALDDLGLEAALSSYVENWSRNFGVPVQLHAKGGDEVRLTPEIETALYRIAQEALNNVAKHAQAARVAVVLERRDDQVSLIIEDDGVGFDPERELDAEDTGLGLIGMRERATLVGGTVEIESQPNYGATVVVRITVPSEFETGERDE